MTMTPHNTPPVCGGSDNTDRLPSGNMLRTAGPSQSGGVIALEGMMIEIVRVDLADGYAVVTYRHTGSPLLWVVSVPVSVIRNRADLERAVALMPGRLVCND